MRSNAQNEFFAAISSRKAVGPTWTARIAGGHFRKTLGKCLSWYAGDRQVNEQATSPSKLVIGRMLGGALSTNSKQKRPG